MKDRRVQRTKHALRRALLELVTEYGFEQISVQQIVDRADVGRSTFYTHFVDKEDLLRENIRELGDFLRLRMGEVPEQGIHPALRFARPMFEHVAEVKDIFAALQKARMVQEFFFEMLCELLEEEPALEAQNLPKKAAVAYVAGGFLAVARWWVSQAPEHCVEEVYRIYLELVSSGFSMLPQE